MTGEQVDHGIYLAFMAGVLFLCLVLAIAAAIEVLSNRRHRRPR